MPEKNKKQTIDVDNINDPEKIDRLSKKMLKVHREAERKLTHSELSLKKSY